MKLVRTRDEGRRLSEALRGTPSQSPSEIRPGSIRLLDGDVGQLAGISSPLPLSLPALGPSRLLLFTIQAKYNTGLFRASLY